MLEIIAISVGILASIGALGHTGYKIYKTYKQKDVPTVIINQDDHHHGIEEIIVDTIKKDNIDDIEVKINIHTHKNKLSLPVDKKDTHLHKD